MNENEKWLEWAVRLQAIAQTGLHYGVGKFDLERYEEIRDIAAQMISYKTEIPKEKVRELFCNEIGYQTPKIATRAAIFKEDKILLVQESNGTWAMPGGWADVDISVKDSILKEVKEEAGLDAKLDFVIAVQDREKHNRPIYAYKICLIFALCSVTGGKFEPNLETIDSRYFGIDELPELATEKNTKEQIQMCFDAYHDKNWRTMID